MRTGKSAYAGLGRAQKKPDSESLLIDINRLPPTGLSYWCMRNCGVMCGLLYHVEGRFLNHHKFLKSVGKGEVGSTG